MTRESRVQDSGDEREMTDYLLGALSPDARARIFDRLAVDEAFFENMGALEDDLILRWHRGELSPRQRKLFAEAYSTPARRTRVDAALGFLRAAEAWKHAGRRSPWQRFTAWVGLPSSRPRFAMTAASVVVIALVILGTLIGVRRLRDDSLRPTVVAVTLSAAGDRGDAVQRGFDRVDVPPGATTIQLTLESATLPPDGPFTAEITAIDRGEVLTIPPSGISRLAGRPAVTVVLAADRLADGDYVLALRYWDDAAPTLVSRQPFRVTRQSR